MPVPMPSSPSQEASSSAVPSNAATQSLTVQVHRRFADFRDRHPHSSLTALLESGPAVNAAGITEYVVRATISLEGRPLVSSLAAAPTIEEAEDRARLRNLALAEAVVLGSAIAQSPAIAPISATPQSAGGYGSDDGLGDTLINLGPLDSPLDEAEASQPQDNSKAAAKSTKPKPKPKKSATAAATSEPATTDPPEETAPAETFVADWSEDLAQISVELKRLNWDSQQEQDYLQRTFNKASRDDIIDHSELMDYLGYLQALPSHFEEPSEIDETPIAEAGLSMDEADLAPQSVSELMASAGLKSGAEIPAPPPAVAPTVTEAEMTAPPDVADEAIANAPIIREPEPEIEIADEGPDETPEAEPDQGSDPETTAAQPSQGSLSRSEMMDETARLCKQLGWKNRQGSDFLQATYNKATRKDLTDAEMMDFLEQLRSLSTTEALPY